MAIDPQRANDPLGRAMYDYHRGVDGTLHYRDGTRTRDGNVEGFYFQPRSKWADQTIERLERLATHGDPVLDVGCGSGQHVRWFEDRRCVTTGIDVDRWAVATARARGADDVLVGDMFDLPFEYGQFRSLQCVGTQLGLGGSLEGISALLEEFARVTDDRALAVVDNYDPRGLDESFLGYRSDPRDGVAHRCFHFEYRPVGDDSQLVGPTLHFLLCSPDRLREATIGTPWTLVETLEREAHYVACLEKGA
ncbi:class I SAM-dependent methyltransferase [Saliphagus sp. GCM10025308]